jgi:RNA polymerase sigma-70 factor (ECF subfamily)
MTDQDSGDAIERLAQRARAGDSTALDALLQRIQPLVLRRCARRLTCPSDAEEACNDALLQVARNIEKFEGRSRFQTWLYPIVERCVLQTYRVLKRRGSEFVTDLPDERPVPYGARVSVVVGARIDILDAMDHLGSRSAEQLECVLLRDLAEFSYEEIATRLDLPLTTVRARVHAGRQIIKAYLKDRRSRGSHG